MNKAVFLDRDGTLNVDKGYLYRIVDFQWMPGAKQALRRLHEQGYMLIVVTNQSGVARGYYTEEDVKKLHEWMCADAEAAGAPITACYYCPYLPGAAVAQYDADHDWRKPAPGMILSAAQDYHIDLERSFVIGDKPRDVECGLRAGTAGYLFTGNNLDDFVRQILAERNDCAGV